MKYLLTTMLAAMVISAPVRAEDYGDISIPDLKKAIAEKKVTIIDVNGSDSYKEAHIPTAIDFEANKEKLAEKLPADKASLIVAYCGGPSCGAYKAAAKAAVALGYTNVKHLSAGISGWKEAKEATEKCEAEKKSASTGGSSHHYVAVVTGVTCNGCKTHVREAIAKLPGGSEITFEAGEKEGTQVVKFTATCSEICKSKLTAALGEEGKAYVVEDVKLAKN